MVQVTTRAQENVARGKVVPQNAKVHSSYGHPSENRRRVYVLSCGISVIFRRNRVHTSGIPSVIFKRSIRQRRGVVPALLTPEGVQRLNPEI